MIIENGLKNLLLIVAVILCSFLVGCRMELTKKDVNVFESIGTRRIFVDKETGVRYRIFVDKETRVQYIIFDDGSIKCVSVRLDADGKPMVDRGVKK